MSRNKELVFNTIIIGIGKFSTQIISVLLLPLYTSILSTQEYGTYDLIITISTFLVPFITLLMEESMFRFLIDAKNMQEKQKVISQTFIYTMLSTIFFSVAIFVIGKICNVEYVKIMILFIISNVILALRNSIIRGLGKIKLYSAINAITSILVILLNILFIAYLKVGYKGLLYSVIIANLLTSMVVFIKLKVHNFISYRYCETKSIKEMIKYSIPLVPNSISWAIINLSDRLIISSVCGTTANGVYSMANKFPSFMDTIYGFFYTAWKESAAKALQDEDVLKFYNNIYDVLKRFLEAVIIGMIAYLPIFFPLLIKKDFGDAYVYIPPLLISMYFSNMSGFLGGIFTAYKNTKIMGTTTVIASVINLVIDLVLIKSIGIWAGVVSTCIATITVYIFRANKVKKYVKIKDLFNLKMYPVLLIVCIAYYCNNYYIHIITALIITLYCIYLNKNIIMKIVKKVFNK